jgi:NadR type nicotinamide-nucleotide adenylyltransferase
VIKVVVTGSESSGKTELATRLAERYRAPLAREFVREFAAVRGGKIDYGDHGPIARGQMASEDAAVSAATEIAILDTDLFSTVAYCEHYFGRSPEWIVEEARKRAADLYLLVRPDIPWIADGIRDRGERRDEMHALFHATLRAEKLRYVEIGGDRSERLAAAVDAIDALRL